MLVIVKALSFLSLSTVNSFTLKPLEKKSTLQIGKVFANADGSDDLRIPTESDNLIPVRFLNFDSGNPLKQAVTHVSPGTNLLKAGDELGINIPRQCRTGVCGICTGDVRDPTSSEGARAGYQTVRLCKAGAMIPDGCDEMVIDLYRMLKVSPPGEVTVGGRSAVEASMRVSTGGPATLSNFADGWEDGFLPSCKREAAPVNAFSTGRRRKAINSGRYFSESDAYTSGFSSRRRKAASERVTKEISPSIRIKDKMLTNSVPVEATPRQTSGYFDKDDKSNHQDVPSSSKDGEKKVTPIQRNGRQGRRTEEQNSKSMESYLRRRWSHGRLR